MDRHEIGWATETSVRCDRRPAGVTGAVVVAERGANPGDATRRRHRVDKRPSLYLTRDQATDGIAAWRVRYRPVAAAPAQAYGGTAVRWPKRSRTPSRGS